MKKGSFITNSLLYTNRNSQLLFFAVGACLACKMTIKLIKNLFLFLQPPKDLAKRYGKGSWVLITGASSGIGKAFAFEFAQRGFNLVLLSRSQEKLDYVSKALKYKNPETQTRVIAADLINAYQENFIEDLFDQIKDLNISILINNAGDYVYQPFIEIPTKKVRDLILLDTMGHALMLHAFLKRGTLPKQKKAIINISSIGAAFPRPNMQIHCASKVFLDYLSQGLASEFPDYDIISLRPNYIKSTNLTEGTEIEAGAITPEEFVQATLSSLGKTRSTYGHWKHIIRGSIETFLYTWLEKFSIDYIL